VDDLGSNYQKPDRYATDADSPAVCYLFVSHFT
jgi:hypothetical protein